MTPLDRNNLAENVRRLAGLHLVSLEQVGAYAGISRAAIMRTVSWETEKRSYPTAETAIKLAEAFAVSLNDLYSPPEQALGAAVEGFDQAPIKKLREEDAPSSRLTMANLFAVRPGTTKIVIEAEVEDSSEDE
jgi:transcriptional regulator with XRE-family HTH domain